MRMVAVVRQELRERPRRLAQQVRQVIRSSAGRVEAAVVQTPTLLAPSVAQVAQLVAVEAAVGLVLRRAQQVAQVAQDAST